MKPTLYAIKLFFKKRYDYFINLDAKTIMIKECSCFKKFLEEHKNENYFAFNKESFKYYSPYYIESIENSQWKEDIIKRKIFHKHWKCNSDFHKLWKIVSLINPRNISKVFFMMLKRKSKIDIISNLYYDGLMTFSRKEYINWEHLGIEFQKNLQSGSFLCVDYQTLNSMCSNKKFKFLLNKAKKLFAPEEWFWQTLYFWIFNKKEKTNVINISIDWKNDKFYNNLYFKKINESNIFFLKRAEGSEEIKIIKDKLKKSTLIIFAK